MTEIYIDNMEMLSPKGSNSGAPASDQSANTVKPQPVQPAQQSQVQAVQQDNPADDLPF